MAVKKQAVANRLKSGRAATALRLAGASFSEIADTLGLDNTEQAIQLVHTDLASRPDDVDDRASLRREEAARLERLMRSVWGKATNPADPEHIPAARVALAVVDRHARLLGLDSPTEVVIYTPTTSEIDQWVASIVSMQVETAYSVEEADVLAAIEAP